MTILCSVTQMFSFYLVTGSHHEGIKAHLHDCKFRPELVLQRSTNVAPLQTGEFMKVQKVIGITHDGRMYYEHLRAKDITSDLVNSQSQISSVLCFREALLCQSTCPILTSFLCISLSHC